MKLRILIIDNFIPQTEVEKIRDRAEYNEETDCWKLRPINNTRFNNTSICILIHICTQWCGNSQSYRTLSGKSSECLVTELYVKYMGSRKRVMKIVQNVR